MLSPMHLAGALLLAAVTISPAIAQPPPTSSVPAPGGTVSSREFVKKAAITGLYEIKAAQVAEHRSHDPAVDTFAARMISDHSKNAAKLKSVASSLGITVPLKLDLQHKGLVQKLEHANASQFDSVYAHQQIQGHRDAIALFTSYEKNGENSKLRQYAKTSLPVLDHHLHMAKLLPIGPQMAGGR